MKFKIEIIARNIVNPEAITDFINKVSKGQSDKIKVWCNTILKNYLKNEYDNLKDVTKNKKTDPAWLQEAVKRKDAQKIIINDNFERLLIEHIFHYFDTLQGNSIKHSFLEAEKQTKEWENKENLFNIKLIKGVKEILKCKNNFAWFEITDEETLYNEGEVLQNCMRKKEHGPEYWERIQNKEIKIFTLRDSKGIGHVGVEYKIKNNFIEQMLGKQNDDPIEIYHPSCVELLKFLKCKSYTHILKLLNMIAIGNKSYDIFNLPDNLEVDGTLDLGNTDIKKLPNNLKVKYHLIITGTLIKKIPDNTIIGDNINVNSELEELGTNIEVGGNLYLSNTKITKLPNNLRIGENLTLTDLKIEELPNNLKVGNNLLIDGTNINKLPNNLKIGGTLFMDNTKITNLPKDLEVKGVIFISKNMKVTSENKKLLSKIKIIQ